MRHQKEKSHVRLKINIDVRNNGRAAMNAAKQAIFGSGMLFLNLFIWKIVQNRAEGVRRCCIDDTHIPHFGQTKGRFGKTSVIVRKFSDRPVL